MILSTSIINEPVIVFTKWLFGELEIFNSSQKDASIIKKDVHFWGKLAQDSPGKVKRLSFSSMLARIWVYIDKG